MPERLHLGRRNRKTWFIFKPARTLLYRHEEQFFRRKGVIENASERQGEEKEEREEGSHRQVLLPAAVLVQQDREESYAGRAVQALEKAVKVLEAALLASVGLVRLKQPGILRSPAAPLPSIFSEGGFIWRMARKPETGILDLGSAF